MKRNEGELSFNNNFLNGDYFSVMLKAMTHPQEWTVVKLGCDKNIHKYVSL